MIDAQDTQVLTDLMRIIESLDLPMMLVGAGARLLVFDRKFGTGRSTKDWDVAVSINSWEAYQNLREALTASESSCFSITKDAHKFIHTDTGIEIDIVPFGEIGEPDQKITWIDSGNDMNVAGFAEALSHAKKIKIGEIEISVVDTPALVVLKLFAWGDRGERTNKDLEDIDFILSNYEDDERVYAELVTELAEGAIDFLDANIYLLGQDIGKILRTKTLDELTALLNKLTARLNTGKSDLSAHRLQVLQKGILSQSP